MGLCVDEGAVLGGMSGVIGIWIHRGNLENGDFMCNGPIIGWPGEDVMRGDDVISLNGHTLDVAFAFFLCCVFGQPRAIRCALLGLRRAHLSVEVHMPYVAYAV
jgi:hypothetical protein